MLPPLDESTGYLPPGEHEATWREMEERFGWNPVRRRLLAGLRRMALNLRDAGCRSFFVDGSFVTSTPSPGDYDACCDFTGMNPTKIDLRLFGARAEMKAEYLGELFPEQYLADGVYTFREFFQTDRNDVRKGIVRLLLESIP